jgi:hypothetical protein
VPIGTSKWPHLDLTNSFGALFGAFRRAVLEHCPEGFGGTLEHDWPTDTIVFRLRSDGLSGSVTKALDMNELREFVTMSLHLAGYPAKNEVIAARDRLMLETLP